MSDAALTPIAAGVFAGTPTWVFLLFAYLAWQGAQRVRPQVTTLRRVAVTPLVFIVWGLIGLFARPVPAAEVAAIWAATAAAGGALGAGTSPRALAVDRRRGLIRRPGSLLPLVRNLTVFGAHYGLNIAMALRPEARATLVLWDIAVSGLSAGYFLGWLVAFVRASRRAPETDLAPLRALPAVAVESAR